MGFSGIRGVAYLFCQWFVRLVYVNFLWMVFSLLGLIVLGVFPATVAMFSVTRQWVMGNEDAPLLNTFMKSYKKEFAKANGVGILLLILGYLLYVAIQFVRSWDSAMGDLLFLLSFSIILIYSVVLIYIFPVAAHYDAKIIGLIKNAFVIGISHPLRTLIIIISCVSVYIVLSLVDLLFFFFASTLSLVIMWAVYRPFTLIDERRESL